MLWYNGRVMLAIAVILLALGIAGTVTNIMESDAADSQGGDDSTSAHYTIWRICVGGHCHDYGGMPECLVKRAKAWRAMAVSSIVLSFLLVLLTAAGLRGMLTVTRYHVLLLCMGLLWACTLAFWALFVAFYQQGCGSGDQQVGAPDDTTGSKWGPSPILFIVMWVLTSLMFIMGGMHRHRHHSDEEVVHILA